MDQATIISMLVLLIALLLPVLARVLRRYPKWLATAGYALLALYAAAYLYETLLFRTVKDEYMFRTEVLWSYREALVMPDGLMSLFKGTARVKRPDLWESILLNILLCIPLGYLLPFVFAKLKGWHVLLIAFLCSVLTEGVQLVFRLGWFEFDDIINNTLGAVIGLVMYLCIIRPLAKQK